MRHIHWRSFARLGEPVVKEFQDEFFTRYALVLDTFGDELPEAAFEAAVSVAASFVDGMHTQDALLDLMFVEDRTWRLTIGRGLGQQSDLLRVLAFVVPRPGDQFARLAQHVLLHGSALSACVLVLLRLDDERRALAARTDRGRRPSAGAGRGPHAGNQRRGRDPGARHRPGATSPPPWRACAGRMIQPPPFLLALGVSLWGLASGRSRSPRRRRCCSRRRGYCRSAST